MVSWEGCGREATGPREALAPACSMQDLGSHFHKSSGCRWLTRRHKSPVAGFGLGTAAASAPAPERHALSVQAHPQVSAQEEEPGFVNPKTLT